MKRTAIIGICLAVTMTAQAKAKPLVDILIGGAFMISGGVFEIERGKAKEEKEKKTKEAVDHLLNAVSAGEKANYYWGAADWELVNFGKTSFYFSLRDTGNSWSRTATGEATLALAPALEAEDSAKKENLSKGVSLTSFTVGSLFIVKGVVTYLIEKHAENNLVSNPEKTNWTKNWTIAPTRNLDGAQLRWAYKWDFSK